MPKTKRDIVHHVQTGAEKTPSKPLDLLDLLGPAPLIDDEDAAAYAALRDHVCATVVPTDAVEVFWVRDIVDLLWETLRMRRLKAQYVRAAAHEGLAKVLTPHLDAYEKDRLVRRWARNDREARDKVTALLKEAGLDETAIYAQTLALKIDTIERIDRLIAQSEARRNAVLREVDRRREAVARRLRDAVGVIEDAEFTEIDATDPAPQP